MTRTVTGPLHVYVTDGTVVRCSECGHIARLSEPYCQVTA